MTLWQVTGLVAHGCLVGVGLTLISRAVPQLRKANRDRGIVLNVLLIRMAVLLLLAGAVTEIHFIATELWQIALTVVLTGAGLVMIRRLYGKVVAPPRHRAPWMNGLHLTQGVPRRLSMHSHRR